MISKPSNSLDEQLYAEIYAELVAEFGYETEAWVSDRLVRVMARLNAVRQDGPALTAYCLGISEFTAFTMPGRNI